MEIIILSRALWPPIFWRSTTDPAGPKPLPKPTSYELPGRAWSASLNCSKFSCAHSFMIHTTLLQCNWMIGWWVHMNSCDSFRSESLQMLISDIVTCSKYHMMPISIRIGTSLLGEMLEHELTSTSYHWLQLIQTNPVEKPCANPWLARMLLYKPLLLRYSISSIWHICMTKWAACEYTYLKSSMSLHQSYPSIWMPNVWLPKFRAQQVGWAVGPPVETSASHHGRPSATGGHPASAHDAAGTTIRWVWTHLSL